MVFQLHPAATGANGVTDHGKHRRLHLGLHYWQLAANGVPLLGVSALGVPRRVRPQPDKALESALTAGGIAEVFEDVLEGGFEDGNVTLLRAWRNRANRFAQLGDSSEPRVSKTL